MWTKSIQLILLTVLICYDSKWRNKNNYNVFFLLARDCYSTIFGDFYRSHVISMSKELVLDFASIKTPYKKFVIVRTWYDVLVTICDGDTANYVFVFDQDLYAIMIQWLIRLDISYDWQLNIELITVNWQVDMRSSDNSTTGCMGNTSIALEHLTRAIHSINNERFARDIISSRLITHPPSNLSDLIDCYNSTLQIFSSNLHLSYLKSYAQSHLNHGLLLLSTSSSRLNVV